VFFRLLGPLDVVDADRPVSLGEGRQRSVLVLLLLHRNEPVARDRLVDALWGESPPATATKVLQNYIGRLRRALDDREGRRLQTHGHAYALRVEDGELDVDRFERLLRAGGDALGDGRPQEAAQWIRDALALWRGPALADVAYEAFAQPEVARLDERRLVALERRIDADLALGRHADLIAELDGLIAQNPLREHLRGQRMLGLYRCGRQAEALEGYRDARTVLIGEIGVEPGAELRRLHEAILRQDPALEVEPPDPLPRDLDARRMPPMAGREQELRWLRERWERARAGRGSLIAVVGDVGSGKTRLAAALATDVHRTGGAVLLVAGLRRSDALGAAIDCASSAERPTLLVVDDADARVGALDALRELAAALSNRPVLVLATGEPRGRFTGLGAGDRLALEPLDADAVRSIALSYAPGDGDGIPADALLRDSRGVPGRVHEVARAWARDNAGRRVVASAPRTAAGRTALRSAEDALVEDVVDLRAARQRADRHVGPRETVVCPFKGLASFEATDAAYFCGRERLIAELVARSVGAPLLAVVGPSGSGKSSVLRAGLMPALADGVLPGSETWPQRLLRPGEHPLRELAAARVDELEAGSTVLAVDQFEEVFTACRDARERAAFIDRLATTVRGRLVVVAVRADFYGHCAEYPALAGLLGANQVLVGPMRRDELRRAIESPAERAGLEVEPELVDALLADVGQEPGGLPLLSSALLELWQRRDGQALRRASYELTGGVRGAVARLAEDAFGRLDVGQQAIARRLLLRLADESPDGAAVRRRVAVAELDIEDDEDTARVLDVLTERRLVTTSTTTVEVAHEALLREWPRLRGWVEEDAEGRRTQRHLTDAARAWDERGRQPGDLYAGARLAVALEWRGGHEDQLNSTERAFLDASRTTAERAQRRLRAALSGVAALLVVAVLGGLIALHQRSSAQVQARIADAQRIGELSLNESDLRRALLLARQGLALADSPSTRGDLLTGLSRNPEAVSVLLGGGRPLSAIDVAPDGRAVAVGGRNHIGVEFLDTARHRVIAPPGVPGTSIVALRYSPDGTRVAVADYNGLGKPEIQLLDARTHRVLHSLDLHFPRAFIGNLGGLAFSPDSRTLAGDYVVFPTVSADRHCLERWDVRTGRSLGQPKPVTASADLRRALGGFTAGGTRIVTSSVRDRSTAIRELGTLAPVRRFPGGGSPADVSPDGRLAVLVSRDGSARLLDLSTGVAHRLPASRPFTALRFTPDSRRLVTAGPTGGLTVWDAATAEPVATMHERAGGVRQIAIARNGRIAYTAAQDGSVIGWDLTGMRGFGRPFSAGPSGATDLEALSPTSPLVAEAGDDGSVALLDSRTGERTRRIAGHDAGPDRRGTVLAISRNGRTLAVGTADGAVRFDDVATGRPLGPRHFALVEPVLAMAMSPDGRWLAASDKGATVYLWNVPAQHAVQLDPHLVGPASGLSISPDGTMLAAAITPRGGGGEVEVSRIPDLTVLARVPALEGTQITFSHDGRWLFYGDTTGRVWTLDTKRLGPAGPPVGDAATAGTFAVSPDDRLLAITTGDGTTQLWDVASRRQVGGPLPGVTGHGVRTAFARNGTALVTVNPDGRGFVWDVRPASWAARACAVAGPPLTRAEWREALPGRGYAPACGPRTQA
jgi:DNA-binding SARP family transcriptional activator/WD40 repeat protein